ncbi:PREDICTED: junctional adhesion molecule-like [Galeopterus variegatus]|uniref:Junctional adhesion molecule-like n=1 Tax=Galeopterus variegatus TaxID=482537 RepID=A0ABM0SH43_GALVR|nr:PREDICTED: junctional adhesion molecule-like [Galeopterus variegatus]
MGCVFQSTEEKRVTKVDWMLSPGEHAKDEYVLYYYANLSVPMGRFQNRVHLVGDLLHNDGSLLLQDVQEADQGTYTCEIRLERESLVFKKEVVLYVLPEEPKELMVHVGDSIQMGCVLQSTEEKHVTMVDWMFSSEERARFMPCSPENSTALVKSLDNTKKANPEKHIYFSITAQEVMEEEEPSEKSEATYMTMHPVWPSLRSDLSNPLEKKSAGEMPKTKQAF